VESVPCLKDIRISELLLVQTTISYAKDDLKMNVQGDDYDPTKIENALRGEPGEIDEYLARKGLKCVDVEEGPLLGFVVGIYYTTRSDAQVPLSSNLLTDFVKILQDDAVQMEFLSINSTESSSAGYSINREVLDKDRLKKEQQGSFHTYRGLLCEMERLPISSKKMIQVIKEPSARELSPSKPPKSSEINYLGHLKVSSKEFEEKIKEAMIAENHGAMDEILLNFLFMDNLKHLDRNLVNGPDKIYEFRVKAVHKIDPAVFEKHYKLLKIQNVIFDLSEFLDWKSNIAS